MTDALLDQPLEARVATAILDGALDRGALPWVTAEFTSASGWAIRSGDSTPALTTTRFAVGEQGVLDLHVPTGGPAVTDAGLRIAAALRRALEALATPPASVDAAREHRLRTHLTVARGLVEAVRAGRVGTHDVDHVLGRALDALLDAESVVDPRRAPAARDRPLAEVIADVAEAFRLVAPTHLIADPVVDTDPDAPPHHGTPTGAVLRDVLAHLLDNAVAHTPVGTTVSIGWTASPSGTRLDVDDDGPWRGLPTAGGGLRTARALVESEGGDLSLRRSARGGVAISARWP